MLYYTAISDLVTVQNSMYNSAIGLYVYVKYIQMYRSQTCILYTGRKHFQKLVKSTAECHEILLTLVLYLKVGIFSG